MEIETFWWNRKQKQNILNCAVSKDVNKLIQQIVLHPNSGHSIILLSFYYVSNDLVSTHQNCVHVARCNNSIF